jgi:hypothetical protein
MLLSPQIIAGYDPPIVTARGLGDHSDAVLVEFGVDPAQITDLYAIANML